MVIKVQLENGNKGPIRKMEIKARLENENKRPKYFQKSFTF